MIGLLDYELTPNIRLAKVMPVDWLEHIGCETNFTILTFNQNEQLLCSELSIVQTNVWPWGLWNHNVTADRVSIPIQGNAFSQSGEGDRQIEVPEEALQRKGMIRLGDSGNPAFLIYKGEPILLYCLSGGGCGSGSYIHLRLTEIQSAMDELALGYKLTFAEISAAP